MKYLFIFILHVSLTAFGKNNAAPVIAWTGQFLGEGEGAAYLDLKLRKFKKTSRGQSSEVNVVLTLQHSLSNRKYAISQKASISKTPKSYWILPSGSYEMIKITAIDNNGVRRTWAGRKALHVPPLNLTYLGTWTLAPAKKSRLKIKIKNRKPKYKHQFDHQTFIALHDGIKNKVIKELGGKDVQVASKNNYGSEEEARAIYSHKVQIGMYYKVDLGKHNQYAKKVIRTLQSQEVNFRNCYIEFLEIENKGGKVGFQFQLRKEDGLVSNIKHFGGSLKDDKLVKCLNDNLGLLQFPLSQNVRGKITFLFKNK